MDVLFHIVDDDRYMRALSNLASLLNVGGVLLLSENLVSRAKPRRPSGHSEPRLGRLRAREGRSRCRP